jgi:hypothetical protein
MLPVVRQPLDLRAQLVQVGLWMSPVALHLLALVPSACSPGTVQMVLQVLCQSRPVPAVHYKVDPEFQYKRELRRTLEEHCLFLLDKVPLAAMLRL